MFKVKYIVNKDVARGLSGYRDGADYAPEIDNNGVIWHTTSMAFETVESANEYAAKLLPTINPIVIPHN